MLVTDTATATANANATRTTTATKNDADLKSKRWCDFDYSVKFVNCPRTLNAMGAIFVVFFGSKLN